MSGGLNGSSLQRPPARATVAAVLAQHLQECSDDKRKVDDRLQKVETSLTDLNTSIAGLAASVELLVRGFLREKEHKDGSKSLVWTIPKPSWKTVGKIALSFSSVVLFIQFLIFIGSAALTWIAQHGH